MNPPHGSSGPAHFTALVDALQYGLESLPAPHAPRVMLGCSGGLDSVTLAHALALVAKRSDRVFALAHIEHGLRGDTGIQDAEWVANLARELGGQFLSRSVDVKSRVGQGVSIEMAARALRREALTEMGHEWQADVILLAHHENDQVETLFLRLARGAGPEGMAGMPASFHHEGLLFLRPWIDIPRDSIEAAAEEQKLSWREDHSNTDPSHRRNRVRHEVLPLITSRLNPQAISHIARAMRLLGEDNALLARSARALLNEATRAEGHLDVAPLRAASPPILRRALARWFTEQGSGDVLDAHALDAAVAMVISSAHLGPVDVGGGLRMERIGDTLALVQSPSPSTPWTFPLPIPGRVVIPGTSHVLTAEMGTGWKSPEPPLVPGMLPAHAWICAKKATENALLVRSWQPGDRLRPHGAGGSRKVQDLFTNAKIPRERRGGIPLVVSGSEVVWVAGYHIADGWQVPEPEAPSVHLAYLALA